MDDVLKQPQFQKQLLFFNGALPAGLLILDWYTNNLGANPPEAVIRTTGILAIVFLLLSLAVTPLSRFLEWNWLPKHRRWLGLFSFYYACTHFFAYTVFDHEANWGAVFADVKKRPFIALGFFCFVLMIPLAVTSTNRMIQKLGGKRWRQLHRLTYVIAIGAVVHFWMIVKSDIFYPLLFAGTLGLLFILRLRGSAG